MSRQSQASMPALEVIEVPLTADEIHLPKASISIDQTSSSIPCF